MGIGKRIFISLNLGRGSYIPVYFNGFFDFAEFENIHETLGRQIDDGYRERSA